MAKARFLRVRGVVQGVGFRPFVYRLAREHGLKGWVLNAEDGVRIHVEGADDALDAFQRQLATAPPPASQIAELDASDADAEGFASFEIRHSADRERPTVRVSPDLPVCDACRADLFDPADRRHGYPYVNCTDCGPRYSIVLGLPYDRPLTTMKDWELCPACAAEYRDPGDRRFHAQPVACPRCGPSCKLVEDGDEVARGEEAVRRAARRLAGGAILAVKGLGGYHLACDARDARAVGALRTRKFRKEKPFALMPRDLDVARTLVELTPEAEALLTSIARPIVLAPARVDLPGVAPGNDRLGVMLPYTPLQLLLFAAGAPDVLVMTSANRSSEPITYRDDDAFAELAGIADAFLAGERPIARRVDDSVARAGARGPTILRRARGYAPGVVARLPSPRPVLAVGADLKNAITLVVGGDAVVSQHIGDLTQYRCFEAFEQTIRDLLAMWEVDEDDLLVVHDLHPQYLSTAHAQSLGAERRGVQHHRAHAASVLAERGALEERVVAVVFDGTGYGDDGAIWGGELFAGSVAGGFRRAARLRTAALPGGDAAARFPPQAAAGFLAAIDTPDLAAAPFRFPRRYRQARELAAKDVQTFPTTSAGRLFDTAAALLGFTREITFEGQAAIWLENLARRSSAADAFPIGFDGRELDWRPLLAAVVEARRRGKNPADAARAFHRGLARGIRDAAAALCASEGTGVVVLSGGVFQNELLVDEVVELVEDHGLRVWTHREVPPNDGGISLGQAALGIRGTS